MGVMDGQPPSLSPLDNIPDQPVLMTTNGGVTRPNEVVQMNSIAASLVGANMGDLPTGAKGPYCSAPARSSAPDLERAHTEYRGASDAQRACGHGCRRDFPSE